MWDVNNQNICMSEGDYGVAIPMSVSGADFDGSDHMKLTIKKSVNGDTILEKDFTNESGAFEKSGNQSFDFSFVLTEEESALLPVGSYVYRIDWYQSGVFMYNIIPYAPFKVVDKA